MNNEDYKFKALINETGEVVDVSAIDFKEKFISLDPERGNIIVEELFFHWITL